MRNKIALIIMVLTLPRLLTAGDGKNAGGTIHTDPGKTFKSEAEARKYAETTLMGDLKDALGSEVTTWHSDDAAYKGKKGIDLFQNVLKPNFKSMTASGMAPGVFSASKPADISIEKTGPFSYSITITTKKADGSVDKTTKTDVAIDPAERNSNKIKSAIENALGELRSGLLGWLRPMAPSMVARILNWISPLAVADARDNSAILAADQHQNDPLLRVAKILLYAGIYSSIRQAGPARAVDDFEATIENMDGPTKP